MLYAIIATDVANSLEKRLSARPAHVERLKVLQAEGRIVLAGPLPAIDSNDPGDAGFTGSLIVAEFASLADAQAWAKADPHVAAGVYADVVIKPFKQVLPCPRSRRTNSVRRTPNCSLFWVTCRQRSEYSCGIRSSDALTSVVSVGSVNDRGYGPR